VFTTPTSSINVHRCMFSSVYVFYVFFFLCVFFCVFFFVCADYEGNTEGVHTTDYWNMFTIPTSSLNV